MATPSADFALLKSTAFLVLHAEPRSLKGGDSALTAVPARGGGSF